MTGDLREHGLIPLAEMPEELARAARGIPLRAKDGTIRAFAMVDAEDHAALSPHKWSLDKGRYAYRQAPQVATRRKTIRLHREVMGLENGDGRSVDHINRDRLDNRRCNLRIVASQAEQLQNVPGRSGRSKHRGVRFYGAQPHIRLKKRWVAQVQKDGRVHHLGYYATEDEAAEVARAWRAEHMPFATD